MRRRPKARAYSTSAVGHTNILATTSMSGFWTASTQRGTSSGPIQFRIAPAASAPANRSIWGRNPASMIGGGSAGGVSSANRRMRNVSNWPSIRSPANAARTTRSTSRVRRQGASKVRPFQSETMTGLEAPSPRTKRPGAALASEAALMAIRAGPRVKTGTIAVPSRSVGAQVEARASGVNASVPATSAVQASVYPAAASAGTRAAWSASGTPVTGMVMPHRTPRPSGMSASDRVEQIADPVRHRSGERTEQKLASSGEYPAATGELRRDCPSGEQRSDRQPSGDEKRSRAQQVRQQQDDRPDRERRERRARRGPGAGQLRRIHPEFSHRVDR